VAIKKGNLTSTNVVWTRLAATDILFSQLAATDIAILPIDGYRGHKVLEVISIEELLEFVIDKLPSDAVVVGDELRVIVTKVVADSVASSDVVLLTVSKSLLDGVSVGDELAFEVDMFFSDTLTVVDLVSQRLTSGFEELPISVADVVDFLFTKRVVDSVGVTDVVQLIPIYLFARAFNGDEFNSQMFG
jgi:hypothetical protein